MKTLDPNLLQYLPQILEQAQNGIVVSDPNQPINPIIYVNSISCELFGYTADDFLGKNCKFLQKEDNKQKELKLISLAIKEHKSATVTVRNYTKDNKLIYNQFTVSPIFDEEGKLKYFLGIQRDVTNEVLLKKENEKLEKDRIKNAQYNAIGKLTGGISHEINTPLTIINGHMEMLEFSLDSLKNNDVTMIKEELHIINNNLKRIQNITESMRELSDIKSFQMAPINIFRPIIGALRLTHNKAKLICKIQLQKEIFDLDFDRDKFNIVINGDFRKLQQVFMILIDNAIDQFQSLHRSKENSIKIDILQNKQITKVFISDNGGGIDESIMENIFAPFNSNKSHKGLGLGLSVAKKIITKLNYDISIENENDGVIVRITIPKTNPMP